MLKKIFEKISNHDKNFSDEELSLLKPFINDGVVIESLDGFELNSKYRIGLLSFEKNFALINDLGNEHKNIKIEKEDLNGAYEGDLVLAKRVFNPRSRTKAKIIQVLTGQKKEILVYIKDKAFVTAKDNIKLENKKASKYEEGSLLLVDSKSLELVKELGNINDPKVDEYISVNLYKEEIRLEKPIEVNPKMDDLKQRVDLTHLPFCTIDPNSAKDHDDAIYFDWVNAVLYVAIADVSYFVKEGSELDQVAFAKSTSAYFPSKVMPMLPNALSEDMCSLKEGVDRYSYVFKIYLDLEKNEVKKSELFEAIINSHRKFSYGRIDRVLEDKFDTYTSLEKEIFDYLLPLYNVTKSFRNKRLKKGYDFRSSEYRLKLKNHELQSVEIETSTPSHQLVEECMLLANIEASKKVNSVGIFRIHEEPAFKAISKLVDDVTALGISVKLQNDVHDTITHIQKKAKNSVLREEVDELIIQSQTQAKYSSHNLGHFGLGFKSYSHFTSPIRRYSDLVLHRMLKSKKTPKEIDTICEHISVQERKVDQMVWDYEDRKFARWALKNIGAELKVKIVDDQRSLAVTYGQMAGMKISLDNYKGQVLFSKQRVIIKSSDIMTRQIIGSIKY